MDVTRCSLSLPWENSSACMRAVCSLSTWRRSRRAEVDRARYPLHQTTRAYSLSNFRRETRSDAARGWRAQDYRHGSSS